jgi:hypothetical protein
MEPTRKKWNERQKKLRALLSDPFILPQAIELFLQQHAEVHSGKMSPAGDLSFEDEVLAGLTEAQLREVPNRMDHSIAWILWHLARIEDVTMNILVAGQEQVFSREDWKARLGIPELHTGNMMSGSEVVDLSTRIDINELRKYRVRVGLETERIVKDLNSEEILQKVTQSRLDLLTQEKAVVEDAKGLIDYWSKRTIAGLLLMPPTRHCFIHLNEAAKIRKKVD